MKGPATTEGPLDEVPLLSPSSAVSAKATPRASRRQQDPVQRPSQKPMPPSRITTVMTDVLRHTAARCGLHVGRDGLFFLDEVLQTPRFTGQRITEKEGLCGVGEKEA